ALATGSPTATARTASQRAWRSRAGERRSRRSPASPTATAAGTCQRALSTKVRTTPSIPFIAFLLAPIDQRRQLGELLRRQLAGLHQAEDQALGRAVEHAVHQVAYRLTGGLHATDHRRVDVGAALELAGHLALALQDVEHRLHGVVGQPALRGQMLLD